ncbi:hypothetical protein [Spongiibacter sp.]|uniref:hypothetical protein n=1 Tax=Spongiibacter sp. TaxID=2024860 RepID=UPI00257F863E|nr:hypothetical protein [Spongiibacter sp.]
MADTPETIYLIPGEDVDGAPCMVWCDDPAPSRDHDPAEAVKYIRADKHQEIIDRQAKAAKMGMDAAKKSAEILERHAKQMLAESSPEVIESERAANAVLTDRVEELETMVKVFRGCIETGLMPEPGSPCQRKVFELVGERGDD